MPFYDITFTIPNDELPEKMAQNVFKKSELLNHVAIINLICSGKARMEYQIMTNIPILGHADDRPSLAVYLQVFADKDDEVETKAVAFLRTVTHFKDYDGNGYCRSLTYYTQDFSDLEYESHGVIMAAINNAHIGRIKNY